MSVSLISFGKKKNKLNIFQNVYKCLFDTTFRTNNIYMVMRKFSNISVPPSSTDKNPKNKFIQFILNIEEGMEIIAESNEFQILKTITKSVYRATVNAIDYVYPKEKFALDEERKKEVLYIQKELRLKRIRESRPIRTAPSYTYQQYRRIQQFEEQQRQVKNVSDIYQDPTTMPQKLTQRHPSEIPVDDIAQITYKTDSSVGISDDTTNESTQNSNSTNGSSQNWQNSF